VIDAFRVESLEPSEQAAGMASYVAAYRVGMLASTAGALYMVSASRARHRQGRGLVARLCGDGGAGRGRHGDHAAGARAGALAPRPWPIGGACRREPVKRVAVAAYGAFSEFLTRDMAVAVLAFVVLYKFCDAFAGTMTAPFVIDLGFTRTDYANIVKGLGLAATLIGGFAGGFVARALPLTTCLWIGAFLQMSSNLVFTWQAYMG
jgi:MFS transporter, PAT family, beta-lactamase induction signal transducer AmpG